MVNAPKRKTSLTLDAEAIDGARELGIHVMARVGRRLGLVARLVAMAQPEACIDADKQADVDLIEAILARR